MPTITISDETYRRLSARAAARGVTLEEAMVEEPVPSSAESTVTQEEKTAATLAMTPEERVRRFDELTALLRSRPTNLPFGYRVDDDRDSFYRDEPEVPQ